MGDLLLVDLGGSESGWHVEPEKESSLDEPVDGENGENLMREELGHRKNSENNPEHRNRAITQLLVPVCQPLSIVILASALDSSDTKHT